MKVNGTVSWKPEITPGNVVSWLLVVAGAVFSFAALSSDVAQLNREDARLLARITAIEARAERDREVIS